jgi:hypothetical protein
MHRYTVYAQGRMAQRQITVSKAALYRYLAQTSIA